MSKKVAKIEFGFENCEIGSLPIEAVPVFNLRNIQKDYHHMWQFKDDPADEISTDIHCEGAHFQIDYALASKVKTNLMRLDNQNLDQENLAQRFLNWKNLTSVTLIYEDRSKEFIWLPYEEALPGETFDTRNEFQSIKVVQGNPWEVGFNEAYKDHKMIIIDISNNT